MPSPYQALPEEEWLMKTQHLVESHPLDFETIKAVSLKCWKTLWSTTVGEDKLAINLSELDIPATIVGYFFEKLFAKELELINPKIWRGGRSKEEKDIVYIPDNSYSLEIKSSGQMGDKIFGNRSYGQSVENIELEKKEKSGYYITVNFYKQSLNLIRFGWIDHSDWKAQKSETGQAAGLETKVYKYKLIKIPGDYQLNAPVGILNGVGPITLDIFNQENILTIQDLKNYQGCNEKILKFQKKLDDYNFS
ncbi:ScaI family restriction endonuclease [Nostoc sp. CMAA1605]|uniref:ScaI family restriction endonuclease n=1 Tax=Nostoc sp. CMAA1605 TaxID=2055159 RepID=UPI001F368BB7|nr:ScaI family restriction endonuclease [Nostoc sp. CMAA1605]MCF4968822.1 ScaI family restriction endonuclease [Nostoc sp. CMAA1605]